LIGSDENTSRAAIQQSNSCNIEIIVFPKSSP